MSVLIDKADFTAHIYRMLQSHGSLAEQEIDGMRMIQMLGGLLTETLFLFEEPEMSVGQGSLNHLVTQTDQAHHCNCGSEERA